MIFILQETNTGNTLVKVFLTAENINFDTQKENRNVKTVKARHTHCIFFRRHDHFRTRRFCIIDKINHFLLAVPVMVRKVTFQHQFRAVLQQEGIETCRIRNGGKRGSPFPLQPGERE